MARKTGETVGNTPRDLLDSFVGLPTEPVKAGAPPKKTRGPKKVTSNTFHSKVSGATSLHRADRAGGYFRKGGFVQGFADGGAVKALPKPPTLPILEKPDVARDVVRDVEAIGRNARRTFKSGGSAKRAAGGDVSGLMRDEDRERYGESVMHGGKYEYDPSYRAHKKTVFEPMGKETGDALSYEKAKRGEHYKKGGGTK